LNILLVDDDSLQAGTRKAILEGVGYTVTVANDGSTALSLLNSADGTYVRIIVTDHIMPGMNGPEFVRLVRNCGYHLPILVLSGDPDAEDEYESLDVAFRVKPFPPAQLLALVQYLLTHSNLRSA
jgi:DNA-binding response OmpR family regulator